MVTTPPVAVATCRAVLLVNSDIGRSFLGQQQAQHVQHTMVNIGLTVSAAPDLNLQTLSVLPDHTLHRT